VLFARFSTNGSTTVGVISTDTSVGGDKFVGATGFAFATPVPAESAASDTASGSRNERFFIALPTGQRDE
jgi:hypothetical protein